MKQEIRSEFSQRQYMLSEDFEVYYYSDDHLPLQKIHAHDYFEFNFLMKGTVLLTAGGKEFRPQEGDLIFLPPKTAHRIRLSGSPIYQRFILWVSRPFLQSLCRENDAYSYLLREQEKSGRFLYHFDDLTFQALTADLTRLIEEMRFGGFGREAAAELLVSQAILSVNRAAYDLIRPEKKTQEAGVYASIAKFIQTHLNEDLSLQRLAEEFFVSPSHISHAFKENLGISPHRYILQKRLSAAESAIRNGAEITDVCSSFGFSDYSGFYRAFRREYGLSPKEYREVHAMF